MEIVRNQTRKIATIPRCVPSGKPHLVYGIPYSDDLDDIILKNCVDTMKGINCSAFVYTSPNVRVYDDHHIFVSNRRKIIRNLIGEIVSFDKDTAKISIMNINNFNKYKNLVLILDLDIDTEKVSESCININKIRGFYIAEKYM